MRRGKIDITKISEEDLATLAANGDTAAADYLWELLIPRVKRVVAKAVKPHKFLRWQREDLVQGVLLKYPVWICRWDRDKATGSFDKWLYFTIRRVCQDVIREQKDTLGIGYPQKFGYPLWGHLQVGKINEIGHSDPSYDEMVQEGLERLDRGFPMSENN